ncbi:MAG TPA: hypothetical protein VNF50_13625 [Acidimicrobiales bacterium]|nr:hypothetical protein [Acidimicrobiales bacterium]
MTTLSAPAVPSPSRAGADGPASVAGTDAPVDLASRVQALRTQVAAGRLDRGLLIVGGVLLPLGLLLIVLAWLGASHTVLLFEQIPYMISGGLLGLALVVVGGFVYFAYWQTLLVREGREQARRLESVLERIESHLSTAAGESVSARANGPAGIKPGSATWLATPTGTMLHRPNCQVVKGRADLRRVAPGAKGYEPCRICRPDLA